MLLDWKKIVLSLGFACISFGCRSARIEEIPGTYKIKLDWGTSILILRPDHTMEQEIKDEGNRITKISGSWEINSLSVFIKPCFIIEIDSLPQKATVCGYVAEAFLSGKADLWIDTDKGLAYEKIKTN